MDGSMELEDDVFFADLSRQISLLIMDDDDNTSATHSPSVSLEAFSQVMHYPKIQASQFMYEQMSRRESKGTGVFIPRSSHPSRRKNSRHTNFSYSYSKSQRPSDNSRLLSNSPHNKNLDANNSTHHSRRFS